MNNKKGLGRGLGALLPDMSGSHNEKVSEISITDISENKYQPRRNFNEEKLKELSLSIKEHGVIQPIIIRPAGQGKYELVAGERRWRACKMLGLDKIPAVVKDFTDKETSEIALIENIQREDLNAIEESMAYRKLIEEHDLTQEDLSLRVGKSRSYIANSLRLLALPDHIKGMVTGGILSAGHARALLGVVNTDQMLEMADKIADKGMSVRQTEALVKGLDKEHKEKGAVLKADPVIGEMEERLRTKLSTKASIKHNNKKGIIEIEYYGDEELQRILEMILGELAL